MSTRKQPPPRPTAQAGTTASKAPAARKAATAQVAAPDGPAEPTLADATYIEPPRSILLAARLMYAGAGLTAIGVLADTISILVSKLAVPASRHATAHQVHSTKTTLIAAIVFSGLIEMGLWVFMARANRAGLSWARIVASFLTAVNTVLLVTTMLGGFAVAQKIFTALTWLVALGVVYFLWRRESSDYFRTPVAPMPSGASSPASGTSGAARP